MPSRKSSLAQTAKKSDRSKPASGRETRAKAAKPSIVAPVNPSGLTIVGIAGSAGALTALQSFFEALPDQTGLAFVVITHLSPEHESLMASLLQVNTKMPVTQVNRKTAVRPDHVYVIPPGKNILISDVHVDVAEFDEPRGARMPIDFFFRTLARSHRDAVAIILSGGGTDGSAGVKDIKEEGGLVMVQDPQEAEYASMPNAAIATGLADVVLPTQSLALKLIEYARDMPHLPGDAESLDGRDRSIVQGILDQVQRRTKHDFSHYKRSTILRRIRRRMLINSHRTLGSYLEYIRAQPAESFALLNDLLIGVTNFFRDHQAWEALKRDVIPSIFKNKDLSEPIRVWSVGCASGEEAYSLGILFLEVAAELDENRTIQIFASDIDEDALTRSREGLYPAAIEADVSAQRLERFFTRQGNDYQVRRELRDMILFTPHSVLRDPPFSHQDLITCRNLLIYLQRDIQQYVLGVFYYALNPGGTLFLGNSETSAGKEALFQTIDKKHHIYQSLPQSTDRPNVPILPPALRPVDQARARLSRPLLRHPQTQPLLLEEQHRRSLETFGPPSMLVTSDYSILHVSDTAGRYLIQPKGPITSDLLKLARPELQSELRTALFQALDKGHATVSPPIVLELDGVSRRVIVAVYPREQPSQAGQAAKKQALIVFLEDESVPEPTTVQEAGRAKGRQMHQSPVRAARLEAQVRRLREQLQTTQQEYDSSTEEMKAANEELQSINEEYHLTAEELETSREELEAVNEELQTVNTELKVKLDELSRVYQDLENVMGAMEIATLFLDRDLRIQRFTPTLAQFFNVLKSDIGRPIDHLSHRLLGYGNLMQDAQKVLESLSVLDRELQGENGRWFLIRFRPYRTVQGKIEGVVITFVDVTALKEAELALHQMNDTLEARVEKRTSELQNSNLRLAQSNSMFSTLFSRNPIPTSLTRLSDGQFLDVNEAYCKFFGVAREDVLGTTSLESRLPFQGDQRPELVARLQREGAIRDLQLDLKLPSGEPRTVMTSFEALRVDSSDAVLATFIDITARVNAERQIRSLAASLTAAEQQERQRISQVLHDDLQQRLFAVKMQLSFLQQAYEQGNAQGIASDTENLDNWLSDAIETTRRLSIDLSPSVLHNSTLADSMDWLVEEMQDRYGLHVGLNVKGKLPKLDEHFRILLFECVRELLFNVVKHSDVLQAAVTLQHVGTSLQVTVSDQGKGFEAEAVLSDPKAAHGLLDIRNRLNLLGCSMQVRSKPGEGTQITIKVPT